MNNGTICSRAGNSIKTQTDEVLGKKLENYCLGNSFFFFEFEWRKTFCSLLNWANCSATSNSVKPSPYLKNMRKKRKEMRK